MKKNQALIHVVILMVVVSGIFLFPAPARAAGTETRLYFNTTGEGRTPVIYGNNIVWADSRNGVSNSDIFLYNLVTGNETQLTFDSLQHQIQPKIYDSLIVWVDDRDSPVSSRIYLYDIGTETLVPVSAGGTSHQSDPSVYGNRIVWVDDRSGFKNIYINGTMPGSETAIHALPSDQDIPVIYGDQVAWMDRRNGLYYNIYVYNLTTDQEMQVTDDTNGQAYPAIYGNRIVWMDYRTPVPEIFINSTAPGLEYSLNPDTLADAGYPAIYGSKVVWQQINLSTGGWDIFMNDTGVGGSLQPVTPDAAVFSDPRPSLSIDPTYGDRIVWQDDRSGLSTVSFYTSDPGTPADCPVASFSADFTGGNAPAVVHFYDQTPPLVTHRSWDFGDGSTSADVNPVHTYTTNNPYSVTLTVGNPWCRNATMVADYIVVGRPVAAFTASPTSDIVPAIISFTDTSAGNPDTWNWSFGDSSWFNTTDPALKDAVHVYATPGTYTVSLTVNNTYGSDTRTRTGYITALVGANEIANTTIDGIVVTNCGGPQTITADSSIVPASLMPNASVLEVQPPADRGFKNITLYALDGTGFTPTGSSFTGHVTGVHLQTKEIVPTGFSSSTGPVSVNYSVDLPLYPCNATLNTKIWEGTTAEDRDKFERIAIGSSFAHWLGTLYTTKIVTSNFPATGTARLHMSADSAWVAGKGGRDQIYIEHILDNGLSGEVLRTHYLSDDPLQNLDSFEADSPRGVSTFGLSALSGSGNPLQLITLTIASHVNPPPNPSSESDSDINAAGAVKASAPPVAPGPSVSATSAPVPADPGKSAKIYANANSVVTQATRLQSTDGKATITVSEGVVAKDASGNPLSEMTIQSLPSGDLPPVPPDSVFTFAGMAYEIGPDGASFSPPMTLTFTLPQAQWDRDYTVKSFDTKSGTWVDLPTIFDASTGTVSVQVSGLCCFALFTEPREIPVTSPAATPLPLPAAPQVKAQPPSSAVSVFMNMIGWAAGLVMNNLVLLVAVIILTTAVALIIEDKFPGSRR